MKKGVTPINMVALLLVQFVCFTCISFVLSFVTFILKNEHYYNLKDKSKLAEHLGSIAAYAEAVVLVEELFLGIVFDTLGRKIPLFIGILVQAIVTAAIPLGTTLYPTFCILRILISVSTVVSLNVPLLPDYVQKEYIGLAGAYIEVVVCLAFIFSSSGLMSITNLIDDEHEGSIYYALGIFFAIVAFFCLCAVKDVHADEEKAEGEGREEPLLEG